MGVFLQAGGEMEMIFNGPMRSGIVLDSQALLNAGYRRFQKELAEKLKALYLGDWIWPGTQGLRRRLSFDVDDFQGETVIPRYLISRAFEGEDLGSILDEFRLPREVEPLRDDREKKPPEAVFTPLRMEIHIYDYGYASCVLRGRITARRDLSIEEYREAAERISSALPDFTELFQSTIAKVAKVIPPEFVTLSFHRGAAQPETAENAWPRMSLGQRAGELFWVHRIFVVRCRDRAEYLRLRNTCRALAAAPGTELLEDKSLRADMTVYPGHGNSCVIGIAEETPEFAMMSLKSVIRAQNVFYAALQDLDRDLFHLNNEAARGRALKDAAAIERHMRFMSDGLARTGFIKSVYDDYDNQLDPQSIAIWDHLRMVWIMGDLFRALDQKTAMADKAYDRAAQRLIALQGHEISSLVAIFLVFICILGVLPSVREPLQHAIAAIVLAFALGAATLLTVRYFRTKRQ